MSDLRDMLDRLFRGEIVHEPGVVTSLAEMQDPKTRPNFSQLFGIVRTTPEEPPKEGDSSPATEAESGTDQTGGQGATS